jgi:hypothetical protein
VRPEGVDLGQRDDGNSLTEVPVLQKLRSDHFVINHDLDKNDH